MTVLDPDHDRPPPAPVRGRRGDSDRMRRRRRREQRLRRTAILALVLVLAGTVLARWREDPGSVSAGGLTAGRLSEAALVAGVADDRRQAVPPEGAAAVAPGAATDAAHADSEDTGETGDIGDQGGSLAGTTGQTVPASGTGHLTPVAVPTSEPESGTGTGTGAGTGTGTGAAADAAARARRVVTYGVDVEDGLPVDPTEFATVVHAVLVDPRGWQAVDGVRFVPVSLADRSAGADVDIRVTLASPDLTAELCAPLDTTVQQVSCWNGSRSVLNLTRWLRGASTYSDLTSYREYLVSHEVGHGLGHAHASCPAPGEPAPVMVQQTKSLEGCTAWPWPKGP